MSLFFSTPHQGNLALTQALERDSPSNKQRHSFSKPKPLTENVCLLKKIFPFKTQMTIEYHVELCFCIWALNGKNITQVGSERTNNNRSLNLWHKA